MEIVPVTTPEQLSVVRELFAEYWQSFGFTPCFQNFSDEVAGLPGRYSPPGGRLAIALDGTRPAGCVALRRLDDGRAEAKRLYVRPEFRGQGIGFDLLRWLIAEARAAGYAQLVCDTMPVMKQAIAMYRRMGFEETGPYESESTPGAIFFRLAL